MGAWEGAEEGSATYYVSNTVTSWDERLRRQKERERERRETCLAKSMNVGTPVVVGCCKTIHARSTLQTR